MEGWEIGGPKAAESIRNGWGDLALPDPNLDFQLMRACLSRDAKAVDGLLSRGAGVRTAMADGTTALHLATLSCDEGSLPVIRSLLDAGASLAVKDRKGVSPVDLVVRSPFGYPVLAELVPEIVYPDFTGVKYECLLVAAAMENPSMVGHLAAVGAWLDMPGRDGDTALHKAVSRRTTPAVLETIRILLSAGADPDISNRYRLTARMLAGRDPAKAAVFEEVEILRESWQITPPPKEVIHVERLRI